jgi:murein DD-endopeptidase MepM/ murein hydrolase activator NlpD
MTKIRSIGSIILLAAALFLVINAFLLLSEAGNENSGETEVVRGQTITPYFSTDEGQKAPVEIYYYPADPSPGDFLLVEAGPVDENKPFFIDFDFQGEITGFYHAGGLLYTIIAISCDAEIDSYSLELKEGTRQSPGAVQTQSSLTLAEKEFPLSRFSMPAERTEGWTAERLAEDREKVRLARAESEPYPLWEGLFVSPLEGRITSEYGAIRIINDNPPRRHMGIDIGAPEGEPVVAPNHGIVRLAEFLLSGGNTVIIDHGMGLSSTYMHLHTIEVEVDSIVEKEQLIGTVGMTGYATGNHLHWEVNIDQTAVNPQQLLGNDLRWIPPAYTAAFLHSQ